MVVHNLLIKDKEPVDLRTLAFLDDHVSRLRFLTLRLDLSRVEVAIRTSWAPGISYDICILYMDFLILTV